MDLLKGTESKSNTTAYNTILFLHKRTIPGALSPRLDSASSLAYHGLVSNDEARP